MYNTGKQRMVFDACLLDEVDFALLQLEGRRDPARARTRQPGPVEHAHASITLGTHNLPFNTPQRNLQETSLD